MIDASLMRAAGARGTVNIHSALCREFLMGVRRICHRIVVTPDIKEEWDKHQNSFSRGWRVSMVAIRKVHSLPTSRREDLREGFNQAAPDIDIRKILIKDMRLIEAALAADRIVISLDDAARGHFARTARQVEALREIVWVNPTKKTEEAIRWLEDGARSEVQRRLGGFDLGSM